MDYIDNIMGCIYGALIGDSLGSRYEFFQENEAIKQIDADLDKHNHLKILGGGPFNLPRGQVSDDGEMTVALLNSIIKYRDIIQEKVALDYIKWFQSNPLDIGNTIKKSFKAQIVSENARDMIENSSILNDTSLSNGFMMRLSPLSIFSILKTKSELKQMVENDVILTHPNKICIDAAFIYLLTIRGAILKKKDKKDIVKSLLKYTQKPRVKIHVKDAYETPHQVYVIHNSNETYVKPDNRSHQGYFGIALQLSLYYFMRGKSFEESLISIIRHGGDTDTNACIAGALFGAYYGYSNIPKDYIEMVNKHGLRPEMIERFDFINLPQLKESIEHIILTNEKMKSYI
jgi:ADP-ribosylglycohydrolase